MMNTPEQSTAHPSAASVSPLLIREATPSDVPEMLAFIRELAEYERAPHAAVATAEDLLRDGFGPRPVFQCLMAEWEGKPAAMALYFPFYSTWRGNAGIHLEDLFVRPQFRRNGIAKALFARLAAIALERGDRFQWHVLDWNQMAIDFYKEMGAHMLNEWRIMRIDGDALKALADKAE
ncbi:GNAT family N-acetyltransferase [Edaphobacter modestus]|uniref:N-acetylglutamate synthase-like GNAT family acetyltransferase n=1 Tax=Edaphobacter modestus TaxID=388466 RepID=A0A4Q7YSI2_9BACT|nr:GNAT family N-acetyltransferase [Edaphobacter modestus]RZU40687.1 N-acetylglutamate synthase-like GNAT family acetyltransferase [Edaphobacter modestus]